MDTWLTIALAAGLAARLTRLITLDVITDPIRRRMPGWLGALVECSWCTGVWVAVPVGLSWYWWSGHAWWQVCALIGTLAWISGAVSNAAMPSQHEVATVTPVALVNADEPPAEAPEVGESTTRGLIDLLADRGLLGIPGSDASEEEMAARARRLVERARRQSDSKSEAVSH